MTGKNTETIINEGVMKVKLDLKAVLKGIERDVNEVSEAFHSNELSELEATMELAKLSGAYEIATVAILATKGLTSNERTKFEVTQSLIDMELFRMEELAEAKMNEKKLSNAVSSNSNNKKKKKK